jgi:L-amino acid N-acyltransferase YncA
VTPRPAVPSDAEAIAAIYNEGIAERMTTFETRPRRADEISSWLGTRYPAIAVEEGGVVIGFAASSAYRPARECYSGVAEFSVYVARSARRRGAGSLAMETLIAAAEGAGIWKLLSRAFVENHASRELLRGFGFREVGVYRRHARLDGEWRDVVIVERLLGEAT